jgi:hypothetical protein
MDGFDDPGSSSYQGVKEPLSCIKDRCAPIEAVEFKGKLP